jgi:fructose-1,6-bisphosphatase
MYHGFAFGSTTTRELLSFISGQPGGSDLLNEHFGIVIEAYLVLAKCSYHEDPAEVRECIAIIEDSDSSTETIERASKLLKIVKEIQIRHRPQLQYVVSKLELASQFER